MRFDDIFNDIDNDTAEKLSQEYPVLTDKEKERLYAMSKRKYNTEEMPEMNLNEVSGVEKYSRPKWYKGLSIAAAAVLVFAGIGGSMAVISRNGHGPGTDTESDKAVVTTEAETTEAVTEAVTEASTVTEDIDADAIAQEMVDKYIDCLSDLWGRTLQVDESDVVEKDFPDGISRRFYRVDDARYPTWEDLRKHCYDVFDTEFAEVVLGSRDYFYAPEDEMTYETMFFTRGDSYYRLADIDIDPKSVVWDQEKADGELTPEGDIVATMSMTYTNCSPNFRMITDFRFVNTENGWRIKEANESSVPLDENGQPTTIESADPSEFYEGVE